MCASRRSNSAQFRRRGLNRVGTRRHPRLTRPGGSFGDMLARLATFAIDGVEPRQVWGGGRHPAGGCPASRSSALADTAVRESRDRVRRGDPQLGGSSSLRLASLRNLAPAFLRKGWGPDSTPPWRSGCWPPADRCRRRRSAPTRCFGELSLSGEIRDSPGALAVAEGAPARRGLTRLIVPTERGRGGGARGWSRGDRRAGAARGGGGGGDGGRGPPGALDPTRGGSRFTGAAEARPSPTCAVTRRPSWRSKIAGRRRPQTCCWRALRGPARRCSPGGSSRSSRPMSPPRGRSR